MPTKSWVLTTLTKAKSYHKMIKKPLCEYLNKDKNNFDLIRLVAAIAVIYGHSFSLLNNVKAYDVLHKIIGVYSAEWGVKTFFFISGLFVTKSLKYDDSIARFVLKRFSRIWPGLLFVALCSAFIIGPICTNLSLSQYFSEKETYEYIYNVVTLKLWGTQQLGYYELPGVFKTNPFKNTVNGPIWTIPVFVYAYMLMLALHLIGVTQKKFAVILFILISIDSIFNYNYLFFWLPIKDNNFSYIPFCFALGALFSIYSEQLIISISTTIAFGLLLYLFKDWTNEIFLAYTFVFMATLNIAISQFIVRIKRFPDISYGVFLWGWPIQQTIVHFFPKIEFYTNLIICVTLSIIMGYISYRYVEKYFHFATAKLTGSLPKWILDI